MKYVPVVIGFTLESAVWEYLVGMAHLCLMQPPLEPLGWGRRSHFRLVLAARWEPKFLCAEASPQATRASSHLGGGRAVTQESGPRDRKRRLQTQLGSADGSRSEL